METERSVGNMTRGEKAKELFMKGYNCSQSVVGAFTEDIGMDFENAIKMVSGFGGGMGRLREVCGAVSGMFFVVSILYGYNDPKDLEGKKELYARVQELAERFRQRTGSIICKEMLGTEGKETSFVPSERTDDYYSRRPCPDIVKLAADILDEYIQHPMEH